MTAACEQGHLNIAQWLFEHGAAADIRTTHLEGETPMMSACKWGNLAVAKWLFEVGAAVDIRTQDECGWTPMMAACRVGHLDTAKWLFEVGAAADIRVKDVDGETPMWAACNWRRLDTAKWLFEVGAAEDIHTVTLKGCSTLEAVCSTDFSWGPDRTPMVHWLVLQGVANGEDGHVDRRVLRRALPNRKPLKKLLCATLSQHRSFFCMLMGLFEKRSAKKARGRECFVHKLQGHELVLSLVADFVGVVRGRALRNAREAL